MEIQIAGFYVPCPLLSATILENIMLIRTTFPSKYRRKDKGRIKSVKTHFASGFNKMKKATQ
jgi:hypothetical protein